MRFVCDTCKTKYTIPDEKVRRKVLKIRCKNCSSIIVLREQTALKDSGPIDRDLETIADPQAGERLLERMARGSRHSSSGLASLSGLQRVPAPLFPDEECEPEATRLSEVPDFSTTVSEQGQEDWYLAIDGQQYGPMSFSELCSRVKRGETGDEAYVWRDSFEDWIEVGEVPELKPFVPKHPPPPPRGKSGLYRMLTVPNPLAGVPPPHMAPIPPYPAPNPPPVSVVTPLPVQAPPHPGSPTPADAVPAAPPMFVPTAAPLEGFLPALPRQESGLLPLPVAQPRATGEVPALAPLPPIASGLTAPTLGGSPLAAPSMSGSPLAAPSMGGSPLAALSMGGSPLAAPSLALAPAGTPTQRTPAWMIVAAIGGGVTALCGLVMVGYIFLDRGPTPSSPEQRAIAAEAPREVPTTSTPALSPDAGSETEFPPLEVEHSKRPRRGGGRAVHASKKEAAAPAKPEMTAAQKRLLSLYGDKESPTADRPAGAEGRSASGVRRQVTYQDLMGLQRKHKAELQACYERAAKRDTSLSEVKAEVRVTLGDMGTAREVHVQAGDNPDLIACVERNVRRWAFPAVGSQTFSFPVLFRGQ